MRSQFKHKSDKKIIVFAVVLVVILAIGAVILQDIQVPTEHQTQEIEVNLEK